MDIEFHIRFKTPGWDEIVKIRAFKFWNKILSVFRSLVYGIDIHYQVLTIPTEFESVTLYPRDVVYHKQVLMGRELQL